MKQRLLRNKVVKWVSATILVSVLLILVVSLYSDKKELAKESFHIQLYESVRIKREAMMRLEAMSEKDIIVCHVGDDIQSVISNAQGKIVYFEPGVHNSYMTNIPDNSFIVIPEGATIKLADDAIMPNKGGYVLGAKGDEENKVRDITIILNGIINGNNKKHPYSESGNEGLNLSWTQKAIVIGEGMIVECSGDGLDIDASTDLYVEGIKLVNNSGTGVHFGSPRPIKSSYRNLVVNAVAEGNGYLVSRYGFDQSWPNFGVIYLNCTAIENYKDYELEGENSYAINCVKLDKNGEFEKVNLLGSMKNYSTIFSMKGKVDNEYYNIQFEELVKHDSEYLLNLNISSDIKQGNIKSVTLLRNGNPLTSYSDIDTIGLDMSSINLLTITNLALEDDFSLLVSSEDDIKAIVEIEMTVMEISHKNNFNEKLEHKIFMHEAWLFFAKLKRQLFN